MSKYFIGLFCKGSGATQVLNSQHTNGEVRIGRTTLPTEGDGAAGAAGDVVVGVGTLPAEGVLEPDSEVISVTHSVPMMRRQVSFPSEDDDGHLPSIVDAGQPTASAVENEVDFVIPSLLAAGAGACVGAGEETQAGEGGGRHGDLALYRSPNDGVTRVITGVLHFADGYPGMYRVILTFEGQRVLVLAINPATDILVRPPELLGGISGVMFMMPGAVEHYAPVVAPQLAITDATDEDHAPVAAPLDDTEESDVTDSDSESEGGYSGDDEAEEEVRLPADISGAPVVDRASGLLLAGQPSHVAAEADIVEVMNPETGTLLVQLPPHEVQRGVLSDFGGFAGFGAPRGYGREVPAVAFGGGGNGAPAVAAGQSASDLKAIASHSGTRGFYIKCMATVLVLLGGAYYLYQTFGEEALGLLGLNKDAGDADDA